MGERRGGRERFHFVFSKVGGSVFVSCLDGRGMGRGVITERLCCFVFVFACFLEEDMDDGNGLCSA